jgi:hypothetical protein
MQRIVGCPSPILQQSQFDYRGFIADTDFSWPEYGTVGLGWRKLVVGLR